MSKISILEVLSSLNVESIQDIDKIPKNSKLKSGYHIPDNGAYSEASSALGELLSKLPLNNSSVAYRKGYSYFDFFRPHIKSNYFLRLDIKSFFHSISKSVIEQTIESHLRSSKELDKSLLARKVSEFLTIKYDKVDILPIGFPASPRVANLIFRPLDIQIEKICLESGIIYSRYSDDLLFSSINDKTIKSNWFESQISYVISQLNMKLNNKKTIKTKNQISLNGYVISGSENNKYMSFSNERLKLIRKLIYLKKVKKISDFSIMRKLFFTEISNLKLIYHNKAEFTQVYAKSQVENKLKGFRSYLLSLVNYGDRYDCVQLEHKKMLINLIEELNLLIFQYNN
ncbi:RNA-directed DNA polymerase [Pseudoalteromonas sp. NZS127_1]|uniref:reverse transcriptase family protein n=1 Tax=Pseudoalteromonas sp. NZS127_1 TaxID=2792074 RepID=UPI0018CCE0BF|nr:reverse transcriptase family protein [Pseudoalteromonas sp. NZS127_1]MBG9994657.1 RNA-directed DNA polymerase [Pseudoalteromonas sp. NZS127_1]